MERLGLPDSHTLSGTGLEVHQQQVSQDHLPLRHLGWALHETGTNVAGQGTEDLHPQTGKWHPVLLEVDCESAVDEQELKVNVLGGVE